MTAIADLTAGLHDYRLTEAANVPTWVRATIADLEAAEADPDPHGDFDEQFEAWFEKWLEEAKKRNPYI